jgi:hypothetical protein
MYCTVHLRKSANEGKESRNRNSDAAFGTIFRIGVSVFKELSRNSIFIFLFNKAA